MSAEETGSDLHLRFTACSFELHLRKSYRLTDAIIKYHLWNVLMMHCAAVSFCPGALSQVWRRAESFNRFECLILRLGLGSLVFKVCLRLRESKMWLRKYSIKKSSFLRLHCIYDRISHRQKISFSFCIDSNFMFFVFFLFLFFLTFKMNLLNNQRGGGDGCFRHKVALLLSENKRFQFTLAVNNYGNKLFTELIDGCMLGFKAS